MTKEHSTQEVETLKTLLHPILKFGLPKAEEGLPFRERFYKYLQHWKDIAMARRILGKKSLSELLQGIGQTNTEGRVTFDLIKGTAIDLGIRLLSTWPTPSCSLSIHS